MKKKIWSLATMVVMAVAFGVLNSSCSSDGDGGTLSEPEYSDVSAKYNIGSSSPYSSIELTESGHYVVTLNSAQAKKSFRGRFACFLKISGITGKTAAAMLTMKPFSWRY